MDAKAILRTMQRFVLNNSPAILTGIGVAGTVTTAILCGKAAYSAALTIEAERVMQAEASVKPVNPKDLVVGREAIELVWKEFIPPAIIGAATILAILGANHISTKRASALAAAFKISEQMAEEYRQKVREKMGAKPEEMMRSEIAKDRIKNVDTSGLIITGSQVAFWDPWAGRAFSSTKERVQQAVNQINHQIQHNYCASLSDFYDVLDLPRTALSEEFGWNTDEPLEPYFTGTLLSNGNPAIEMRFEVQPYRHFNRHGV